MVPPPLRAGTRGGGLLSIGRGIARDAFATFNNSKFKPYNSFKLNCVGQTHLKGFWESLYNNVLALLVALRTLRPCAQHKIFFEGGGGLTSDARCPPHPPPK